MDGKAVARIVQTLLIIIVCVFTLSTPLMAEDWMLEIIPTTQNEKSLTIDTRGVLVTVLLTNISIRKLLVWSEDYSWGYDNLSFLVTRMDGSHFWIFKEPEGFDVNFPLSYLVQPGGHFAWAVNFSPTAWDGFPRDWKGSEEVWIQAWFEINPTRESERLGVWTGKVASEPLRTTLIRFPKQVYFERSNPK